MTRKQFNVPSRSSGGSSRTFIAKYRGRCSQCPNDIKTGDEAIFIDDEIAHAQCPQDDSLKVFGPVCKNEKCLYFQMQHSGECDV